MDSFKSVIIVTKDRPRDLKNCIGSLLLQDIPVDELIIVDASCYCKNIEQICGELVKQCRMLLKYVHTKPGITYQRNIGISLLDKLSEFVFFFDDDVILRQNVVKNMMETFSRHPDVAIVQGVESNRKPQNAIGRIVRKIFLIAHESNTWKLLRSGENTSVINPNEDIIIGSVMIGISCVKRKIFYEFKFDEWFTSYSFLEDYDFSFRVARKYKLLQTPSVQFIHNCSPVSRQRTSEAARMYIINKAYFYKKNIRKTQITTLSFIWSLFGHLILSFGKSIVRGDFGYFAGTIIGIIAVIEGSYIRQKQNKGDAQ